MKQREQQRTRRRRRKRGHQPNDRVRCGRCKHHHLERPRERKRLILISFSSICNEGRLTSSKVLQSVLVVDGERRVVLGELKYLSEILSKVGNDGVGDLGDVEESVAKRQPGS
jgi:hypothetical protein